MEKIETIYYKHIIEDTSEVKESYRAIDDYMLQFSKEDMLHIRRNKSADEYY